VPDLRAHAMDTPGRSRGPNDRLHYIGGKGNNGGDSYLGFGQVAAVTALMMVAEPRESARR